jgi:hypothetical protein
VVTSIIDENAKNVLFHCEIVLAGNQQMYMVDLAKMIYFPSLYFFHLAKVVLSEDPIWLDEAVLTNTCHLALCSQIILFHAVNPCYKTLFLDFLKVKNSFA